MVHWVIVFSRDFFFFFLCQHSSCQHDEFSNALEVKIVIALYVLHINQSSLDSIYRGWKKSLTWYHMQIAVTGMKMTNTSHATCDITAIVPRSCIIEKAHRPNSFANSKSNTLWSVDACRGNFRLSALLKEPLQLYLYVRSKER